MRTLFVLIASFVLVAVAALVGSALTTPAIPGWYAALAKPTWTPPSWMFAPVWTVLYTVMGVALFLVWSKRGRGRMVKSAVAFFLFHLVVNVAWSWVFFRLHNIALAFAVILMLLVMIGIAIAMFHRIDRRAAWLLVPYLLWVCLAAALNYQILILNVA